MPGIAKLAANLPQRIRAGGGKRYSVGMFTCGTHPSGSVVHAAAVAEALHDMGVSTTLYALDDRGRGFYRPVRCPLVVVPTKPSQERGEALGKRRIKELSEYVSTHSFDHDVFHAQDYIAASALLSTRQAACKVVRTVHHVEHLHDPFLKDCQKMSIEACERLCVVSRLTQWDIGQRFGRTSTVVGNGFADRVTPVSADAVQGMRRRLLGERSGPLVVSFGGAAERKNVVHLFSAFVTLKQRFPDAVWAIGGEATKFEQDEGQLKLEAALATTNVEGDVIRMGVLSEADVGALLAAADVVWSASLQEGFGLVALEAAGAGVPLVVSHGSPFDEYLSEEAVWRVDPYEPIAVAHITTLALTYPMQKQIVARREAVRQSWRAVAQRCLGVYERSAQVARAYGYG
jgi:glycosyltransferase-like protein